MSLYLEFLLPKHTELLAQMPIQIFFLLIGAKKSTNSSEFIEYCSHIDKPNWATSTFTKSILSMTGSSMARFKKEVQQKELKIDLSELQQGCSILKQLMEVREINEISHDFRQLTKKAKEIIDNHGNFSSKQTTRTRIAKRINGLYTFPLGRKSLSTLLMELPYQLFLFMAEADGEVDKSERSRVLKILRQSNWCKGKCSQDFFVRTAYAYDSLYKKQISGELKKDWSQVVETLQIAESFFIADEMGMIKDDLLRLSEEIASSSGGFVGFGAIDKNEKETLEAIKQLCGQNLSIYSKNAVREPTHEKQVFKTRSYHPVESYREPSTPSQDRSISESGSERNSHEQREEERIAYPDIQVEITGISDRHKVEVVNIAQKGILCRVTFDPDYVDLVPIKHLTITFPGSDDEAVRIESIHCRYLRSQAVEWGKNGLPHCLKIAWQIVAIPSEQKEEWNEMMKKVLQQKQ